MRSKARTPGDARLLALACIALGARAPAQLVLPTAVDAATSGNGSSTTPWGRAAASPGANDLRVQLVYDSSEFTSSGIACPITIDRLRFRADEAAAPWTGGTFPSCTIWVGAASLDYRAVTASAPFDANHLGGRTPATPSYAGPVRVAPGAVTGGVGPWCIDVALTVPAVYDPRLGHDLILDLRHDGAWTGAPGGACPLDVFGAAAGGIAMRGCANLGDHLAARPTSAFNESVVVELGYTPVDGLYPSFTVSEAVAGFGEVVTFTDTSFSTDASGVVTAAWDFDGDGTAEATGPVVQHAWFACGPRDVTLTVTDTTHGSASVTRTGAVEVRAPLASFEALRSFGAPPATVVFTDTSERAPAAWAWDLDGDGRVDSTEQNPTHVYSTGAQHRVTLTASSFCGSDTATVVVDTRRPPEAVDSWPVASTATVAYDPITDEVAVLEGDVWRTPRTLHRYRRDGAPIASVPVPLPPGGITYSWPAPVGAAVDPLTGDVWGVYRPYPRVQATDLAGNLVASWPVPGSLPVVSGIAFDPETRTVFVGGGPAVQEFDLVGNPIGPAIAIGGGFLRGLAYDPVDRAFVCHDGGVGVSEFVVFDRGGAVVATTPWPGSGPVALDTRARTVFVAHGGRVEEVAHVLAPVLGFARSYGDGCADQSGSIPICAFSHVPAVHSGTELVVHADGGGVATLWIGAAPVAIDVGPFLGVPPGCVLHTLPRLAAVGPLVLNANRRAGITLDLGGDPSIRGFAVFAQAVLFPNATPQGLAVSNGAVGVVQ